MDAQNAAELPRYKCHKDVWALKIKAIEIRKPTIAELQTILDGGPEIEGATITPEDNRYAPFIVSHEYVVRHDPKVGGYYVVYKDGYRSFSPADAFEEGYSLA